ncbi:hypothetical protein BSLG_003118 [Batrachochytrium salamandrivorans]|nr:hypothetical protein BSLG_003118 [Batrachochytrium salamandrivorans]
MLAFDTFLAITRPAVYLVIILEMGLRELKMTLVGQLHFGDSELQLVPEMPTQEHTISLKLSTNLAPISDFCVVDIEKQGQVQLVACSGAQRDGSLRIIRNGIGVEEIGQLEDMQEMTGVWGVKPLQKLDGDAMGEVDLAGGFRTLERTLWCQNMPLDLLVPDYSQLRGCYDSEWMLGDNSIRLFNVPDLLEIRKDILAGDTIPRSILLVEFDNAPYLLVSLGDGQLFFHINASLELQSVKDYTWNAAHHTTQVPV